MIQRSGLILVLCSLSAACGGQAPHPAAIRASLPPQSPHTVVHDILAMEGEAVETPPEMVALVDEVLRDIAREPQQVVTMNAQEKALATFLLIDGVLLRHHIVAVDASYVPVTLHDALRPALLDQTAVERLAASPANAHRRDAITTALEPTFYPMSSPLLALLYVAAGQVLKQPFSLVEQPPGPNGSHYVYVRWIGTHGEEDASWDPVLAQRVSPRVEEKFYLNMPMTREQAAARRVYGVAMSKNEILGFGEMYAALEWGRSGNLEKMHGALDRVRQLRPSWPGADNQEAWFLATTSAPELRNSARAIGLAKHSMSIWPCPSSLDTLAAAFAAAGRWDEAVRAEGEAVAALGRDDGMRPRYRERLDAYQRQEPLMLPLPHRPSLPARGPESRPVGSGV